MSAPVIVPKDIAQQGEQHINSGVIQNVKKGVELLLQHNLYIEGTLTSAGLNQREVSNLLKKGLTALANAPHETLGIAVGAKTQEIRKAYKKNALKYHPDKNPLTTPLFQVIHAAHDKLSDRELRAKEERMAAASAANVAPKGPVGPTGPTRQSYGGPNTSNNTSNTNSTYQKPTYEQRRSTFDAKPSAQQQSSYYNREPQPQAPKQQQQEYPQSSAYARYQEEEQLRKQRYEEFLKEQQKKVESDKRAKEFAARAQAQAAAERAYYEKQQADARKAAADFKQAADIQAEIAAKREEVLRAAAAAAAAGQAYRAGEAQSGKYGKPPAPGTSTNGSGPSVERDSYRQPPNPNLRSFNTNGPANPSPSYSAYSTNYSSANAAGASGNSGGSNTAYSNAHNAGGYSPRYGDVPTSNNSSSNSSYAGAGGPGVGRTYKASADGNVYPNTDAAPNSARGSAPNSSSAGGGANKVPPINVTENRDAKDKNEKYKYKYVYPPGVNDNKTPTGYAKDAPDTARSEDSRASAGGTTRPPSAKGSVPRPFGLKCTSVTTSVVELEWNTSATYRNMLSVELSWRYLGTASKHNWESANKLISSGKCRKKNLVSGGQYEFKVRAVEELVGGMLGNRSEWSESIFVTLARESSKDLNSLREDKKPSVPASVEVPVKPTAAATASSSANSPTGVGSNASPNTNPTASAAGAAASTNPTKPTTEKIPSSFQRFNPKSESPVTVNPTASASGGSSNNTTPAPAATTASAAAIHPEDSSSSSNNSRPHRTQVPPVGAANVPPPIHRFTTINETSPSAHPTSTTTPATAAAAGASAPSVPPSRVGSSLGDGSKNVLNSSAREAWGKDTIKIPSTPDKPNPNNNVSGTNNSRTFQVKSAAIPSSASVNNTSGTGTSGGGANATPASGSAGVPGVSGLNTITPPSAAHGVPPSSSRSSTLPAEYDAEYEVDEEIDYEDSRSPSPEGTHIDEEDEEDEEVSEEADAAAAGAESASQQYSDDGAEVDSEEEEEGEEEVRSGESEGIAYHQSGGNKQGSDKKMEKRLHHAKVSPTLSHSTSPSNQKSPYRKKKSRDVDSDDDDDADPAESPVLRFKSVNPNLIPPHLKPPNFTAGAASTNETSGVTPTAKATHDSEAVPSVGKNQQKPQQQQQQQPSVQAAIEAEDDDDEEDHYSEDEDEFDQEEEQYFDLVAPSGTGAGYKHPVRAEPFMKSKLIGHLLMGCTVLAIADCGDWLKVKVHQPTKAASAAAGEGTAVWGWCLRAEQLEGKRHEYLHKVSAAAAAAAAAAVSSGTNSSDARAASSASGVGLTKSTESQSTSALPSLAQQASAAAAALKARLVQQQQKTEDSNKPTVSTNTTTTSGSKLGGSASTSKLASPVPTHKSSSSNSTNSNGGGNSGGKSKERESLAAHISPLHPSSHLFTPTAASVAASINHSGSSAAHLKSGGKVSPPTAGSANEKQFHSHKVSHKSEGRKAPKTTPSKEKAVDSANNTPTTTSTAGASGGGNGVAAKTSSNASPSVNGSTAAPSASTTSATASTNGASTGAGAVQDAIDGEKEKAASAAGNPVTDKLPNLADRKSNSIRLAPLAPNVGSRSTYNLQAPSQHSSSFAANHDSSSSSKPNTGNNKSASGVGDGESIAETWLELFDTSGHPYYYNEVTGESSWEAPEWIEEKDPASGHKYYVKASDGNALTSTWTKPKKFAKLIRQVEVSS